MPTSEDYLDRLLHSMENDTKSETKNNTKSNAKNSVEKELDEEVFASNENHTAGSFDDVMKTDDDFLREFEEELLSDDEDQLVKEFESTLLEDDVDALSIEAKDGSQLEEDDFAVPSEEDVLGMGDEELSGADDDFLRAMDDLLMSEDKENTSRAKDGNQEDFVNAASENEKIAEAGRKIKTDHEDDSHFSSEAEMQDKTDSDIDMGIGTGVGLGEDNEIDDGLKLDTGADGEEGAEEKDSADNAKNDKVLEEDTATDKASEEDTATNQASEEDAATAGAEDADLMDLLSGLGEDNQEFADISDLLKADEAGVENMSEAELDSLQEEGKEAFGVKEDLSENGEDANEDGLEGKGKKKKKGKKEKKKEGEKKESFFSKFIQLLFGKDEEEEGENKKVALPSENTPIEDLSAENLAILKELDMAGEGDEPAAEEDKKGKKEKKKKEKKPKEKKPKEPKPKKVKPPKEKKEKVKDNTPPLPKGPVIVLVLFGISLLVLVMLCTKLQGYQTAMDTAKQAYEEENYTEAFLALDGKTIEDKDLEFYEKTKILAEVSAQYTAYESMVSLEEWEMALDCLIRGVGRCDNYAEQAKTYGIEKEVAAWRTKYVQTLSEQYGVSEEQAVSIYDSRKRKDYTLAIEEIVSNLGLDKTDDSNH